MPKGNDSPGPSFIGGFESSVPENHLEDNHATKSGGPELAEASTGIRGSYGGRDSSLPTCYYEDNHSKAAGGGSIPKADE